MRKRENAEIDKTIDIIDEDDTSTVCRLRSLLKKSYHFTTVYRDSSYSLFNNLRAAWKPLWIAPSM